jgi:hypothetical protein
METPNGQKRTSNPKRYKQMGGNFVVFWCARLSLFVLNITFCQVYNYYNDKMGLQPFSMEHLKGAFFAYFGLNGIAILVAICEKLMKKK